MLAYYSGYVDHSNRALMGTSQSNGFYEFPTPQVIFNENTTSFDESAFLKVLDKILNKATSKKQAPSR